MSSSRQLGLSLVEVVVFIVVLGIGLAGMAVVYNQLTLASVDPVVRKQAVAIANSLMEEILLRPFTYCDPDDAAVFTAASPAGCTTPEVIGAEGGETRYGPAVVFDNVSDYGAFAPMVGSIQDVNGNTVTGLTGYTASVAVAAAGGDFPAVPADDALLITVSVSGPANMSVILKGYRLRYAPNSP